MHTKNHSRRNALGFDKKRRQSARSVLGTIRELKGGGLRHRAISRSNS
jgi:hypothetical protein